MKAIFSLWAAALLAGSTIWGAPVLMISIDGMRPDAVTHAAEHGLKVPNLQRFMKEGVYATGVTGVVPTITFPSHTTLVTGVWPAQHGIYSNNTFDPFSETQRFWYWRDIRVPTLWQAADQAGIVTASVNWPVTVAAKPVRYLIPEYWRARNPEDRKLLEALTRPADFLTELEAKLGDYTNGDDTTVHGDEIRTKFAIEILSRVKPGFMTLHLTALDETQHESAPFSAESNATLEALDGMVGRLTAAALANDANAVVAVVSDHGFARTDVRVNLTLPFIEQGFIKPGANSGAGPTWDAAPWPAGPGIAVILHQPEASGTKARVKAMLDKLAANPEYGIARVLDGAEVARMGGFPDAAYFVELKLGYALGTGASGPASGPMVTPVPGTGQHGYLPDRPEMRSAFFLLGRGLATSQDLGIIDMRQVAPTLAAILGVKLPSAAMGPIVVTRR
ncbi:MAG TPA: ectonucleotide pyrophosphatase/phosphodiesterase [Bryobacteraceae bacterium]|nr:ectonucleotide pyrophosphatase/phosphodiesterase [Bryobacteraceae bacterium]